MIIIALRYIADSLHYPKDVKNLLLTDTSVNFLRTI
jgi:hypothetical protein